MLSINTGQPRQQNKNKNSSNPRSTTKMFQVTKRKSIWIISFFFLIALCAVMLSAQAENQQAIVISDTAPVDEEEGTCSLDALECKAPLLTHTKVQEFIATKEWKEIAPNQGIPAGIHVRMNLETGKKEGKLIDPKEKVENQGVVVDPQVEKATPNEKTPKIVMLSSDTKGAGSIVTTAQKVKDHVVPQDAEEIDEASPVQEPNWNHEKMYEVLQALPEPPQVEGMDLHDAHAKLSNAEFRKQMIKLWKKRQSDLKEAIESMQDDAKYFAELLEKFRKAENDPIEQMNVLEVLEYEVHDLDKAQVFNFIGGFQVVVEEALQASNYGVRSHAAWLIGSAVKNYKEAQEWALDAGALPKLIDCLKTRIEKETREEIIELKKKALYAIASLARSNERAQRLLLTNGGVKPLEEMMEEEYPLNLKFRVTLFVHDILSENLIDFKQEKMALEELQSLFRSSKWCQLTAQYFKQSKHVHREVLQALNFQVFSCIKEFTSLHLDQVLDAIISVWQNKAKQHPDEIEDDDLERIKVAQELLAHLNK